MFCMIAWYWDGVWSGVLPAFNFIFIFTSRVIS